MVLFAVGFVGALFFVFLHHDGYSGMFAPPCYMKMLFYPEKDHEKTPRAIALAIFTPVASIVIASRLRSIGFQNYAINLLQTCERVPLFPHP